MNYYIIQQVSRLLLKSFLISGISISVTLQQCKAIINLNKAILIAGRTKKNNESLLENVIFRIFLLSDVLTRKYTPYFLRLSFQIKLHCFH